MCFCLAGHSPSFITKTGKERKVTHTHTNLRANPPKSIAPKNPVSSFPRASKVAKNKKASRTHVIIIWANKAFYQLSHKHTFPLPAHFLIIILYPPLLTFQFFTTFHWPLDLKNVVFGAMCSFARVVGGRAVGFLIGKAFVDDIDHSPPPSVQICQKFKKASPENHFKMLGFPP